MRRLGRPRIKRVSPAEKRVLVLTCEKAMTVKEICECLHLAEATVENHRSSIYRKSKLVPFDRNAVKLAWWALREGYIKIPDPLPRNWFLSVENLAIRSGDKVRKP